MTTYAVTGATGHLGRLAVEALLDRGVAASDVIAIARSVEKASDLAAKGVQVRQGDYDDQASLTAALQGVDRLALISASEIGKRVPQHKNVIAAAEAAGVSRIVYTSVIGAGTTSNPVAPEHVETEAALSASSIPATILRNSWYIENYSGQVGQYTQTGTILGATNGAVISMGARKDYAEAVAVALIQDAEGVTYELGGDNVTLAEFAAAVTAATGTPVTHTDLSAADLAATYVGFGMDEGLAGFWAAADASIAAGELFTESTDLTDLIGRPATTVAEVLEAK